MPLGPKKRTRGAKVLDKPRNPSSQVGKKASGTRQANATRRRGRLQKALREQRKK